MLFYFYVIHRQIDEIVYFDAECDWREHGWCGRGGGYPVDVVAQIMSVGTFHILQSHVHVPAFILIRENFESKELVFIPGEIEFGNIKSLTVCRLREVTCIACFNVLRYRGFLHLLPVMEVVREERAGRVRSMYFPAAYLRIPLLRSESWVRQSVISILAIARNRYMSSLIPSAYSEVGDAGLVGNGMEPFPIVRVYNPNMGKPPLYPANGIQLSGTAN